MLTIHSSSVRNLGSMRSMIKQAYLEWASCISVQYSYNHTG